MLKKTTTVIASNHKAFARKAAVMGSVILGIGIGLILNHAEDPDMVVVEEYEDDTNNDVDAIVDETSVD